jgi:predicted nucleotidyltransferase
MRKPIFSKPPWIIEQNTGVFCYDCHEELLHNPVLLPEDIEKFAALVKTLRLDEETKPQSRELIAGRIKLFHLVIEAGLKHLLNCERIYSPVKTVNNTLDFEAYRREVEEICRNRSVKCLELFGSAADGSFNNQRSDIDFLVTFLELGPGQHADAYFGLIEDFERLFGRRVDLVSPDCIKNPFLLKCVNESRKLVYKVDAA